MSLLQSVNGTMSKCDTRINAYKVLNLKHVKIDYNKLYVIQEMFVPCGK